MLKANNRDKFSELRARYPLFIYEGFEFKADTSSINVHYRFNISDHFIFTPALSIPLKKGVDLQRVPAGLIENILFHIGMTELVSYWKCTCSPTIIIRNYRLTEEQKNWWKKLYYNGLGEFMYMNDIRIGEEELVRIESEDGIALLPFHLPVNDECLIPVGGGKDSVVTLELLGNLKGSRPFILNPRGATLETTRAKGFKDDEIIKAHRTLDPLLLELNARGFLNGHTPFSALLAFITVLTAVLSGNKYIALSNESSANEATIPGTRINHQYSKSVEFESDFREYLAKYITPDIDYFSFLRPLNELQIASLFARFPAYLPVFKSCNAGSKTDTWCGKCSKCLFTYIILSPFLNPQNVEKIFGSNLLNDAELLPVFRELIGTSETKPFDCIGTIDDVNSAVAEMIRQLDGKELPLLLQYYRDNPVTGNTSASFSQHLNGFNGLHFLPTKFKEILKKHLYA
jgi:UDP-N-acetyl-alpha-D-muramoyl-L-alanyl-L-glutamate epimerase